MAIDRGRARQYLNSFDFRHLFLDQLGWDKHAGSLEKVVDGQTYRFQAVSEKRGVVVLVSDSIPDYTTRAKLDRLIAKDHFEHLIVFADESHGRQVWQWMRRESGKPNAIRAYTHSAGQSSELLLQKLEHLVVTLEDEEQTGLTDVLGRMRAGFDVEKVTKKFYERFKAEHERFLKFIDGIPDKQMETWYASVMINRLMFLYFIQAKSFLNGDLDYLRNKLKESRDRKKDSYYRDFLCPLFFEGFARKKEERSPAVNKLLGTVPYLNGGLFQRHQIEELHGKKIHVPDSAFDHLFDFFKDYDWHLDDREAREGNEINPDVLGYIFEKYINQKQMGAYYTKEDITEYISKSTIIPFLLDAARKDCAVAFDKTAGVWRLLRDDPDRYIYAALRHGATLKLPPEVAAGLSAVDKRTAWNRTAPSQYALPTELWREVVERRRRYEELRRKLAAGEVAEVNDLVTLNLDIRQFAQDVIQYCEGPELLRALYKAISKVSVLDPTCGSGAFLFAALNILKPMYEACLQRMQMFVDELDAGPGHHPKKFEDFRQILEESKQHPKQDYFILKSIIVNNLYGVDIMEEAVEICKLRLFLKLVAQVDSPDRIEPLPDIDFNIQAGNSLVGYARYSDVEKAVGGRLDFENAMGKIEDKAKQIDSALEMFRAQQTKLNGTVTVDDKTMLRTRFGELEEELNEFLAADYGAKKAAVRQWKDSHKPLHWFSQFHRIMALGGFDVIIGNPPYIEHSKLKGDYQLRGLETISTGNLYCPMMERSFSVANAKARFGMIVPLSYSCTERMTSIRKVMERLSSTMWISHFSGDANPSKLFEGVKFRLDIVIAARGSECKVFSSSYLKWFAKARPELFSRISFAQIKAETRHLGLVPKTGGELPGRIVSKLLKLPPLALDLGTTSKTIYVHRVMTMFIKCFDFIPYFYNEQDGVKKSEDYKPFCFKNERDAQVALAVLNSSTFFYYFLVFGDCFHCGKEYVQTFPLGLGKISKELGDRLIGLGRDLMIDLKKHAVRKSAQSQVTGRVEYDEFWPRNSKSLIDQIDVVLAQHYGLTDEELDFIVNYDIKYRLGANADEE